MTPTDHSPLITYQAINLHAARICHIMTAYRPDLEHFEQDLRTRMIKP